MGVSIKPSDVMNAIIELNFIKVEFRDLPVDLKAPTIREHFIVAYNFHRFQTDW